MATGDHGTQTDNDASFSRNKSLEPSPASQKLHHSQKLHPDRLGFLDLSAEIRNSIYKESLKVKHARQLSVYDSPHKFDREAVDGKKQMPISPPCRANAITLKRPTLHSCNATSK